MSLLCDDRDPTTALFLSIAACARAGRAVQAMYGHKIKKMVPRRRMRRGELLGYALVIHFKDKRPSTPLTNSDFERVMEPENP